jgi:hypothetical protein
LRELFGLLRGGLAFREGAQQRNLGEYGSQGIVQVPRNPCSFVLNGLGDGPFGVPPPQDATSHGYGHRSDEHQGHDAGSTRLPPWRTEEQVVERGGEVVGDHQIDQMQMSWEDQGGNEASSLSVGWSGRLGETDVGCRNQIMLYEQYCQTGIIAEQ